jgi:hypothetical protein
MKTWTLDEAEHHLSTAAHRPSLAELGAVLLESYSAQHGLLLETDGLRFWLTPEDESAVYKRPVTIEVQCFTGRNWATVCRYNGAFPEYWSSLVHH